MSKAWVKRLEALGALEGETVVLEPLVPAHDERLRAVALDAELWRWTISAIATPDQLADYLNAALRERAHGSAFPYAIVERASGQAVGSTRFGNIDADNRKLEIGWTWVGGPWQRTGVNTEAKYLLLRTGFEHMGCVRVEFKTDVLNEKSRAALKRIGAQEEGILRRHMITATGRNRDTVYFSILDLEWPAVKAELEAKLRRGTPGTRERG
jgi:RimJ/RimL family protein N-acetyltransferase